MHGRSVVAEELDEEPFSGMDPKAIPDDLEPELLFDLTNVAGAVRGFDLVDRLVAILFYGMGLTTDHVASNLRMDFTRARRVARYVRPNIERNLKQHALRRNVPQQPQAPRKRIAFTAPERISEPTRILDRKEPQMSNVAELLDELNVEQLKLEIEKRERAIAALKVFLHAAEVRDGIVSEKKPKKVKVNVEPSESRDRIIEFLKSNGPATRKEIANALDLRPVAVYNIIRVVLGAEITEQGDKYAAA